MNANPHAGQHLQPATTIATYSLNYVETAVSNEEISTIFVVGFPEDIQEREFQNMFLFAPGFEAATLKLPQTADDDASVSSSSGRRQIIGFAKFRNRSDAADAIDVLNGKKVDSEKGSLLKAEMAKKNLHTKRSVSFSGSDYQPTFLQSSSLPATSNLYGQMQFSHGFHMRQLSLGPLPCSESCVPSLQSSNSDLASICDYTHSAPSYSEYANHVMSEFTDSQVLSSSATTPAPCLGAQWMLPASSANDRLHSVERENITANGHVGTIGERRNSTVSIQSSHPEDGAVGPSPILSGINSRASSGAATPSANVIHNYASGFHQGFESALYHDLEVHFSGLTTAPHPCRQPEKSMAAATLSFPTSEYKAGATPPVIKSNPIQAQTHAFYHQQLPKPVLSDQNNPPCNTLYVGNLPMNASEDELRTLFVQAPGYKRMSFRQKPNGPMCFVEFENCDYAAAAMDDLYGTMLTNSTKG